MRRLHVSITSALVLTSLLLSSPAMAQSPKKQLKDLEKVEDVKPGEWPCMQNGFPIHLATEATREEMFANVDLTGIVTGTTIIGGSVEGVEKSKQQIKAIKDEWKNKDAAAKAEKCKPVLNEKDIDDANKKLKESRSSNKLARAVSRVWYQGTPGANGVSVSGPGRALFMNSSPVPGGAKGQSIDPVLPIPQAGYGGVYAAATYFANFVSIVRSDGARIRVQLGAELAYSTWNTIYRADTYTNNLAPVPIPGANYTAGQLVTFEIKVYQNAWYACYAFPPSSYTCVFLGFGTLDHLYSISDGTDVHASVGVVNRWYPHQINWQKGWNSNWNMGNAKNVDSTASYWLHWNNTWRYVIDSCSDDDEVTYAGAWPFQVVMNGSVANGTSAYWITGNIPPECVFGPV